MLSTYDPLINKAATAYNIPVAWIKAIIMTESSGKPDAYRDEPKLKTGSYGLGQFLPATAASLGYKGDPKGLFDPAVNIDLIGKYLADLRIKYGDDVRRIYSAYNSGRPDLYKSSTQVGKHVQNFMGNLNMVMKEEPFILSMGLLGGLLVMIAIWYWSNSTRK